MPRDILSGCKILATVTYATKAKALAEPRRAESRYALIFMFLSIKSGRGIYATHSGPVSPWSLATLLGRRTPLAATSSRFPDLSESWCCHGCCCRLLATNEASKDAAKSRGNASLRATNYSATVGTTMPGWRRSMGSWEGHGAWCLSWWPGNVARIGIFCARGHIAQEEGIGGGGTRGRVVGVMPRQSDVQSRKAYVLRMESLAPPWTAITDRVTTLVRIEIVGGSRDYRVVFNITQKKTWIWLLGY